MDALAEDGEVEEVGPGRLVARDDLGPPVTVVVTPEQWQQVLAERAWGDVSMYVMELLGPREDDETYVVFHRGRLHRSTREALPPVRGRGHP